MVNPLAGGFTIKAITPNRGEQMSETSTVPGSRRAPKASASKGKKWWIYVLVAALAVCAFLAFRSASTPVPVDTVTKTAS